jgi:alpha-L-fucosidase
MPNSASVLVLMLLGIPASAADRYQATWESLRTHPNPQWFDDAKFGIYFHWGPYSVPAFDTEWYARNMYRPGHRDHQHHLAAYGPLDRFGYKDFIPLFTAENFRPDEWADLFVRAGAKFAGPVAEHADGFSMWDSRTNRFNAVRMGPKRDVVGEIGKAVRRRGLKFIATLHHQWLWAWYPTFDPGVDASNPEFADLYGPRVSREAWDYQAKDQLIPDPEFCRRWEAKVREVIDQYQPDLLWFDSRLGNIPGSYRKDFLAYYYNRAGEWGHEVAVTYKNQDLEPGAGILDLERGRMARLMSFKWLTDDALSWKSWSYIEDDSLKPPKRVIDELVDIVSKNGNLLLDIGPKADGTIPEPVKERLLAIGGWLRLNGEAIYGTRPWETFGEGPTQVVGDSFGEAKIQDFTARDIRFTTRGATLYAIVMGWPEGPLAIASLATGRKLPCGDVGRVEMLGAPGKLEFSRGASGLTVRMPAARPGDYAYVLKITGASEPLRAPQPVELVDVLYCFTRGCWVTSANFAGLVVQPRSVWPCSLSFPRLSSRLNHPIPRQTAIVAGRRASAVAGRAIATRTAVPRFRPEPAPATFARQRSAVPGRPAIHRAAFRPSSTPLPRRFEPALPSPCVDPFPRPTACGSVLLLRPCSRNRYVIHG